MVLLRLPVTLLAPANTKTGNTAALLAATTMDALYVLLPSRNFRALADHHTRYH